MANLSSNYSQFGKCKKSGKNGKKQNSAAIPTRKSRSKEFFGHVAANAINVALPMQALEQYEAIAFQSQ